MKTLRFLMLPLAMSSGWLLASGLMAKTAPAMAAVLKELAAMNPPPIEQQEPRVARDEPSPADAAISLLAKYKKPATRTDVAATHMVIPATPGGLLVRVYRPLGASGTLPGIIYFHGGGWVIANLNTYDASCRALCAMTKSIVFSVAYRQAPEFKFPAAHDDAYNATKWLMDHAASMGADPRRVEIAGESAGGNLAAATCLRLKREGATLPVHLLSVYPIAGYDFETPSYRENAAAKPLNRPMMQWFFSHYLNSPEDGKSDYISLDTAGDLQGMPPTTIVLAEIDPLRSEGEIFAQRLRAANVPVEMRLYHGVTHEFFGMGALVPEAASAETFAAMRLKAAFRR